MAEVTVPVNGTEYEVELYRTRKAIQIKVPAGARVATATEPFNVGRKARNDLENDLRRAVVTAWVTEFGKLDWDLVQFFIVHTSGSVTVEIAVGSD